MHNGEATPRLRLVHGTLEAIERAAFLACFADEATFEAALARLRAVREVPAPHLESVTPREGGNPPSFACVHTCRAPSE